MDYLDQLKGLNSPDLTVQIGTIAAVAAELRANPSSLMMNTVAIHVATRFRTAPNRLRYFLTQVRGRQFFLDCALEMQTLKSKREVFEQLTAVLDTSDAVAQMLLLRILGALAPVLSGLLDIQHKVLLAVDSRYKRVRDMALMVLPALLPSASSLARHIFRKDLDPETLIRLCQSCPDDQEAVTRAYALCQKELTGEMLVQGVVALALRSSSMLSRAVRDRQREVLMMWREEKALGYWLRLCRKYGCQTVISEEEARELHVPSSHALAFVIGKTYAELSPSLQLSPSHPLLSPDSDLSESDYKSLLRTARLTNLSSILEFRACKLLKRHSPESTPCLRLISKSQGRLYTPELVQSVLQHCSKPQLAEIAHVVMVSIGYGEFETVLQGLNPWEMYQTAVKLIRRGEYRTAQTLLGRVVAGYESDNIACYQWLQALMEVVMLEQNLLLPEQVEVLSRLACTGLGEKVTFQSMFMILRIGLLQLPGLLGKNSDLSRRSALILRDLCEELRYFYPSGPQDHAVGLREWGEWMSAVVLMCEGEELQAKAEAVTAFLPSKASLLLPLLTSSVDSPLPALGKLLSTQRFRYPRRFFLPSTPLSLRLHFPYDEPLKIHSQDEYSVEFNLVHSEKGSSFPSLLLQIALIDSETGSKLAETVQRRKCSEAGVVNSSVLVRTPRAGNFLLRAEASVVTGTGRKVGKREFSTLRIVASA